MKFLISIVALTLALAVNGPAFAGDATMPKTKAECEKAGWPVGCLRVTSALGQRTRLI